VARSVKSAERTLALFELFSLRQRPLTVGRIASELNMPQASVSMLLTNLRELGYVAYDPVRRTYTPTIRVALLGSWINRRFDEAGSLTARLTELQNRIEETVFLGIQNGPHGQYVLVLYQDKPRSMKILSGALKLMTVSAIGRSLLALKPDQEVLRWLHRCNAEATEPHHRISASAILSIVNEVRRLGYAQTRGDVTPTYGAIAVPIPFALGGAPMSIGAGVPLERIDEKRELIVGALNDAKAQLSSLSAEALPPVSADGFRGLGDQR
jgi:DNA-binding IclR family transcriptional regulator